MFNNCKNCSHKIYLLDKNLDITFQKVILNMILKFLLNFHKINKNELNCQIGSNLRIKHFTFLKIIIMLKI